MTTKTRIVNIGNSRGIRIPKILLEEAELGDEVELEVEEGRLVVRPVRRPRSDWEKSYEKMAHRGDDRLLDSEAITSTNWDSDEWDW